MIKPGEIQKKARKVGVRDQQIEKDYILSWILQGIANQAELSKCLVFKGGTALKKIYFSDYRFSEDLDFTLLEREISNEQILKGFSQVYDYILGEANIPLGLNTINTFEDGGLNFYINYVGPLGGIGMNKSIKVDISRNEEMQFDPIPSLVNLGYSDQKQHPLLCYSLEEILIEKLRSIMQRMQARDLFDIWFLLEQQQMNISLLSNEFGAKCASKGMDPKRFHTKLAQRLPQYKGRWRSSMGDQIHKLPDFDLVIRQVMRHLKKLEL
ncbi:MAG: nucleotidyl transferase AbiEii/AbiGii toxin family protein [Bacteroidales bacterium]